MGDQFLGADIDFEFDVVLGRLIDLHRFLEVVPQHFAGGASRFDRSIEIMPHGGLARTNRTKCTRKTVLRIRSAIWRGELCEPAGVAELAPRRRLHAGGRPPLRVAFKKTGRRNEILLPG